MDRTGMPQSSKAQSRPIRRVIGARILASKYDPSKLFDIAIGDRHIVDVSFHDPKSVPSTLPIDILDARGCLITPSLCHPHVHLDKAFLMSDPKFADLKLERGDFAEAMELGRKAKERFSHEDLTRRGRWLVAESVSSGVTYMRAFAEVDESVGFKCLEAAIELKAEFAQYCEIQICLFAQEPVMSGPRGRQNLELFLKAMEYPEVEVIGTTPYVEEESFIHTNIKYAINLGKAFKKHVDLHLDYNLDQAQAPRIGDVIREIRFSSWRPVDECVVAGHCTRYSLFSQEQWENLARSIRNNELPISFIGLPTSDLFIQGRPPDASGGGERARATLQIPQMIQQYGLEGAISINNVGNAFTPHGSCDPLQLASWGIGLYQAGTTTDIECLFECVSSRAKKAIGIKGSGGIEVGAKADMVIYGSPNGNDRVPLSRQRPRLGLQDLVCDPPNIRDRRVIFNGCLVEL
ncbi:uncharacterized protein KY384_008500 [Bacidia gigantensis]|uniref:uncharacterized protein n=1 Tax=Bacidia gigantensis TaxID=2732470 RepID=UPI001D0452A8|nr:uncharacterized protein KY384_008500 [Bacidia gigantensis]KAG8527071.1 hypothetical protein KY384_008500 [Bacidia gigantensis]